MDDTLKQLLAAESAAAELIKKAEADGERLVQTALQEARAQDERFDDRKPELHAAFLEKSDQRARQTVAEMDRRYHVLAALGVRNLQQYNQLVRDPVQLRRAKKKLAEEAEGEEPSLAPMPFIVIVIDELADLMITSGRAVEESITRLSQNLFISARSSAFISASFSA